MRKSVLFTCLSLGFLLPSQGQNPVHWTFATENTKSGKTVRLVATIDGGWHIYAETQPPEAISVPTKIEFGDNPLILFIGPLKEKGRKETYQDTVAGIIQYQYTDSVIYTRPFALHGKAKTSVIGRITYQACTGEMCLPPQTIPFSISVP